MSGPSPATGVLVVLLALGLALGPQLLPPAEQRGAARRAGPSPLVGASLPVWGLAAGTEAVAGAPGRFTTASPSLYEMTADGGVALRDGLDPGQVHDALARLRDAGPALVPTVTNTRDGSWDTALAQRVLHDPSLRDQHVVALVDVVLREGLDGVDVDYEELTGADRGAFSAFLARLGPALRSHGRVLAVDVFAKEDDAGYDQRNLAQDYAAIGRAADQVRLMAYDRHWETSPPGPVAPVDWVRRVVAYAVTQVPREALVLGVPTYGYDWAAPAAGDPAPPPAVVVSWGRADALAAARRIPVRWSDSAQSPSLAYADDAGRSHELWFEDRRSTAAKVEVASAERLGGVFLWLVGDVDTGTWPLLAAYRSGDALAGARGGGPR